MTSDPSINSGSFSQNPPQKSEGAEEISGHSSNNPPPLDDLLEESSSPEASTEDVSDNTPSQEFLQDDSQSPDPALESYEDEAPPAQKDEQGSTYGTYDSEEDYQSGHTSDHPDYTDGMQDEDYHNEDPHARYANAYGHDTVYHEEPYIEDDPHYQESDTQYPHESDPYEDPTGAHLEVTGGNGGYGGRGGPPETDLLDPSEMDPDEDLYHQGEVVKPFLEHLEDLRWTLVKVIVSLIVGMVVCLVAGDSLTAFLKKPLVQSGVNVKLMAQGPAVGFVIALKVAFFGGIILSGPFLFYFLAEFVVPALKPKEKKYLGIAFLIGAGLFLSGVSFCYFLVLEISLKALAGYSQWLGLEADYWLATEYFGFVLKFMLGMGISFEMPVVILTLVKLEIITYQQLESNRRIMVVVCLVVAAILTPPDALSMFLLGGPLYALFEACIWIARYWDYRDNKRARQGE